MKIAKLAPKFVGKTKVEKFGLPLVLVTLLALLLVGGGEISTGIRMYVVGVAGAALVIAGCGYWTRSTWTSLPLSARIAIFVPAALPLIQSLPLPVRIWQALPGHQLRLEALALVGAENSWQPLSLAPTATLYTAIAGVIFSAVVMVAYGAPNRHLQMILRLVMGWVALGILIGFMQAASLGSVFKFYKIAHDGALIGFFANKNHMGAVIAASIPLAFYAIGKNSKFSYLYLILCFPAVLATNSRAGFLFYLVSSLLTVFFYNKKYAKYVLYSAIPISVVAFLMLNTDQAALFLGRFNEVDSDVRWQFITSSIPIVKAYSISGAGFGSFPMLYAIDEPVSSLSDVYVNHVHNDYIELLIEAGIAGLLALALVAFAAVKAAFISWRARYGAGRTFACCLIIGIFAAHSMLDYPMRRLSIALFFAIALGALFRVYRPRDPEQN